MHGDNQLVCFALLPPLIAEALLVLTLRGRLDSFLALFLAGMVASSALRWTATVLKGGLGS